MEANSEACLLMSLLAVTNGKFAIVNKFQRWHRNKMMLEESCSQSGVMWKVWTQQLCYLQKSGGRQTGFLQQLTAASDPFSTDWSHTLNNEGSCSEFTSHVLFSGSMKVTMWQHCQWRSSDWNQVVSCWTWWSNVDTGVTWGSKTSQNTTFLCLKVS